MSQGCLGTNAPLAVDGTLFVELAMGMVLIAGAVFARKRCYRAHAGCQSAVVLLNLAMIVRYMTPSFRRAVVPGIPHDLSDSYYWLATAHGVVGLLAETHGVYILLVAGTNLLRKRLRFAHYKPWMQTALVLWCLALSLGVATYLRWHVLTTG